MNHSSLYNTRLNNHYMQMIIDESKKINDSIPIIACIVYQEKIIAFEKNASIGGILHAEIRSIMHACEFLDSPYLIDCDIYVNLEPCPMCLYAICLARMRRIFFAAYDLQKGGISCGNSLKFTNHVPEIYGGIMEKEAKYVIDEFFSKRRF